MSDISMLIYRTCHEGEAAGLFYVDATQWHLPANPGFGWYFKGWIGEQEVAMLPPTVAQRVRDPRPGRGMRVVIDSDEIDRGLGVEGDREQIGRCRPSWLRLAWRRLQAAVRCLTGTQSQ